MTRRMISASMALALSFCATTSMVASPLSVHAPVNAFFGKVKMISFSVRNDSKSTVKLTAGTQTMVIEPGKTVDAKVADGEKLTYAEATATRAAGDVLTTANSQLNGNTIAIR